MSTPTTSVAPGERPQRDRGNLPLLLFAVGAGPVAWSGQLIINYALAAIACFPNDMPLQTPAIAGERSILWVVNILAILLAVAGVLASFSVLRALPRNKRTAPTPHLSLVEGRNRFFAVCGLMTGFGFLVATLFNTFALAMIPSCSG